MRRRNLPSISALTAFEAAARHGSIAQAADELHLSQSAVSRLVRGVELALEVPLFERVRQRIVLTEAGRAYAQSVRQTLDQLQDATYRTMSYSAASGTLSLGVFSTFATKWLLPRLPDFRTRHPEISINCFVRNAPFDFDTDPLDAAIHYGEPVWQGTNAVPLFGEVVLPVASPSLVDPAAITTPRDLLGLPLLHEITRPDAWSHWFRAHEMDGPGMMRGTWFDQFGLVAAAASAGLGIGLIPTFLIEDELSSGKLVVLLNDGLPETQSYYLVYPTRHSGREALSVFTRWIAGATRQL